MNPNSACRSCWHVGGSIERRSGPLSRRRTLEFAGFHLSTAEVSLQAGDASGAAYCLSAALELLAAASEAWAWSQAASPPLVRGAKTHLNG